MGIKTSSFYIKKLANMLRNPSKKVKIAWGLTIAILLAASLLLIFKLGELTGIIYFTSSIPIIIASIVFRVKGGVLTGLIGGTVLLICPIREGKILFSNFFHRASVAGFLVFIGAFIGGTFEILNNQMDELEEVSLYNPNSKMPNIFNLIRKVEGIIEDKETEDIYLLLIDIQNHDEIMNTIGHKRWGEFIKEIGTQLKERQEIKFIINGKKEQKNREMEINLYNIYHHKLGFLVVNPSVNMFTDFIEKLKNDAELPFYYNKIPVYLNSHLGIASHKKENKPVDLFLHAYQAVNIAVRDDKKIQIYNESLEEKSQENFMLLGEVRNGLDEGQFELHYMPKVKLNTGEIIGVEALIRWKHPNNGNISPGKFIPPVERTGLIDELTRWVINRAAKEKKLFADKGIDINMAVNISPRNLKQESFVEEVKNIIDKKNLNPAQFELELTETEIMGKLIEGNNSLKQLSNEGFKVSMDDFGTGYSSLAYLKNLDINSLKIDLSFVQAMQKDKKSYEIVKTAIRLGKVLDKEVVAEGIENQEVMKALDELNCDYGQGYHICKPLPREEFEDFYYNWQK